MAHLQANGVHGVEYLRPKTKSGRRILCRIASWTHNQCRLLASSRARPILHLILFAKRNHAESRLPLGPPIAVACSSRPRAIASGKRESGLSDLRTTTGVVDHLVGVDTQLAVVAFELNGNISAASRGWWAHQDPSMGGSSGARALQREPRPGALSQASAREG